VNQVIAEANSAIGGCASAYSYSELNEALTTINENYDNGNQDQGHLTCQPVNVDERNSESTAVANVTEMSANVYPNPNNGQFSISLNAVTKGQVNVKMVDMMGRVMMSNNYNVVKGNNTLNIDLGKVAAASYNLILTDGANTVTRMINVTK